MNTKTNSKRKILLLALTPVMVLGMLVAIPITALFLALQKYYVEGVTGGAVKG